MQIDSSLTAIRRGQGSFEVLFCLDNHGFARAIWSIHVLYGMIGFSEELFGKVHDEMLIIMAGWLSTVLTIC